MQTLPRPRTQWTVGPSLARHLDCAVSQVQKNVRSCAPKGFKQKTLQLLSSVLQYDPEQLLETSVPQVINLERSKQLAAAVYWLQKALTLARSVPAKVPMAGYRVSCPHVVHELPSVHASPH